MIAEATRGFSVEELMRLKALAEGKPDIPTIDIPNGGAEICPAVHPTDGFTY